MVAELPGKATATGSRLTVLLPQIFLFQLIANLSLDYISRKKWRRKDKEPVWQVKLSDFDPHNMSIYPNTYPTLLYYYNVDDTGRSETIFLTVIVSFW
jgi:hypothetical protein